MSTSPDISRRLYPVPVAADTFQVPKSWRPDDLRRVWTSMLTCLGGRLRNSFSYGRIRRKACVT
jgi:hypothetical protein